MAIKTIFHSTPENFDRLVNDALRDGYQIDEIGPRRVGPEKWRLYARLVKPDPVAGKGIVDAAKMVKLECLKHAKCGDCALHGICKPMSNPEKWTFPG